MKIFISIASYQDRMLETTLRSAWSNASNPDSLRFGVCDQSDAPLDLSNIEFRDAISYQHVDPVMSGGPCWARTQIQDLYDDEDYYLQIDSHTLFSKGWDSYLLEYMMKIELVGEKSHYHSQPIISVYPRAFEVLDFSSQQFRINAGDKKTHTIAFREDGLFLHGLFSRQIGAVAKNDITHGYLLAAGCLFAQGSFVKNIPYDPNYYFYGEELSLVLRAFTSGYSIFHIPDVPVFHLYTDNSGSKRKLHWNEEEDAKRTIKWNQREKQSINRLADLVNENIEKPYNLGTARTLEDFKFLSGMNIKDKIITDLKKATTGKFLSSLDWKNTPTYYNTD